MIEIDITKQCVIAYFHISKLLLMIASVWFSELIKQIINHSLGSVDKNLSIVGKTDDTEF